MNTLSSVLSVALVMTSIVSSAAEPSTAPPAQAAANATPAKPATPATAATAATSPAASDAAANDPEATKKLAHSLGYSPRASGDKTVYCRREAVIGTRLETLTCLSAEQVTAMSKRSTDNQDTIAAMQKSLLTQQTKQ